MVHYFNNWFALSLFCFILGCLCNRISFSFPSDDSSQYFQIRLNLLVIVALAVTDFVIIVFSLICNNYTTLISAIATFAHILSGYCFCEFSKSNA